MTFETKSKIEPVAGAAAAEAAAVAAAEVSVAAAEAAAEAVAAEGTLVAPVGFHRGRIR